jgi:hypothetical protein
MKPYPIVISPTETAQVDADIVIRAIDIPQVEADIRELRALPRDPEFINAADVLQQAVDVARAKMMCPALYAAGSKFAQGKEAIAASALKFFQVAA